jgi:hypothetical protein
MSQPLIYTVENTEGSQAIAIQPRTFDGAGGIQHTTDLTLYGNLAARWGERYNENFLHLLENFAGPDDGSGNPANTSRPIRGQVWFDTTSSWIKVYDGSVWNIIPNTGGALSGVYYAKLEADDTFYDKDTVDSLLNGKISQPWVGDGLEISSSPYILDLGTPSSVTSTSNNIVTSTSHTHSLNDTGVATGSYGSNTQIGTLSVDSNGRLTTASNVTIRSASTSQTGIVQLNDTIASFSTTQAATANAVKEVADTRVNKAGDTMTGFLTLHSDPTDALHAATKQYVDSAQFPTFFSPIAVASGAGPHSWTTRSYPWIPSSAKFIFLEFEGAISTPDSGDVDAHVRIRSALGQPEYLLARGRASGSSDNVAVGKQGMFPLSAAPDRQFQYTVESPGFNLGWVIRLIGYW